MTQISGHSYITCYHPTNEDEWCEIKVKWTHSYDSGDYYNPPYEDTEIKDIKLITYNDKYVSKDTLVPDWVSHEEIIEGIDILVDGYDGNDN
jgi:hypothetical protein